MLCGVPGMRVAGGTDEIMKNIVAERVLGLPKDPGIDSTTAFKDLAVNSTQP
jgi:acyl-CoA dehydrogenase